MNCHNYRSENNICHQEEHTHIRATVMQSCIHAPQRDVWKTRITCDNKSDITHNSPRQQIHVNKRITDHIGTDRDHSHRAGA